jgi:Tol biopolymer transport system component
MALIPNSLLYNRYRILEELGRGGMGAVYRGHDENLGVDVAIKENLFVSPEYAQQFRREATLLASLRHPSLPRVTDHFVITDQGQYLVMDFVAGEDARQRLINNRGPLPEASVLRWTRDILDALIYLHSRPRPVVHRDIKPGNVKITPEGRAVLVDFGLAKIHDEAQATATGAKALSPGFSPPEQYGSGRTDARSDLYALGATMYALLSGQPPPDSLERALNKAPVIPLRTLNPEVSAPVAAAIERALQLKLDERFQNAGEFLAAIGRDDRTAQAAATPTLARRAAPEVGGATVVGQPEPAAPEPEWAAPATAAARRLPWVAAIVLGLLVLVVGGGGAALYASGVFSPAATATPTLAPVTGTVPVVVVDDTPTTAPTAATPAPSDTPAPTATETAPPASPTTAPTDTPAAPTDTPPPAATPMGGGVSGQIAFVSERAGRPQIFLMDADGGNVTQLTNVADGACQPAWSPDGAKLLFTTPCLAKREQYPGSAIYVINADGTELKPFITLLGGTFDADWSEAGVAFVYLDQQRPQIYVADAEGAGAARISAERSGDTQPSWSPGGEMIAFRNVSRSGRPTIYWMFRDGTFAGGGSNPNVITRDVDAGYPAWSPNGQFVAYMVGSNIFLAGWDQLGFGPTQLTTVGPNADPAWSPDAQWIVFESWRDAAQHDIYRMRFNGGEVTRLTNDPALDYQPAWRP